MKGLGIREEKMRILGTDYVDEVDKKFSVNAIRLMASRYLLKDSQGRLLERPKQMFQRVAALIVLADILYDQRFYSRDAVLTTWPEDQVDLSVYAGVLGVGPSPDQLEVRWNIHHLERLQHLYRRLNREGRMKKTLTEMLEFLRQNPAEYYPQYRRYYDMMVEKKFLPNSPTLFNAGTVLGQLSACFVLDVEDDMVSIMDAARDAAIIFKTGGGVGINYSKLRPEGDVVASTGGVASGPVSFMRMIDTVTDVVKQGGRRRGANIGILNIDHPDVEKFIAAKAVRGVFENFNISVMVKPDFWDYFERGEAYPLVNPRDGSVWRRVAENGGSVQGVEGLPEWWSRVFVTALDIPWWDLLRAQHEVQMWVDASVSKTINMPSWVSVEDVLRVFIAAHRLGLKGVTVYRDGSKAAQVLVTPTQRLGRYAASVSNNTVELLRRLGVEVEGPRPEHPAATPPVYETCPVCGGKHLRHQEGCVTCLDCGWNSCVIA
jgi:ribonucleotide reductase alpha subunit